MSACERERPGMTLVWSSAARRWSLSREALHELLRENASRVAPLWDDSRDEATHAALREWAACHALTLRHLREPVRAMPPGEEVVAHALTVQAAVVIVLASSMAEGDDVLDTIARTREVGILRSLRTVVIVQPVPITAETHEWARELLAREERTRAGRLVFTCKVFCALIAPPRREGGSA